MGLGPKGVSVDMVETFNWLLGLKVRTMEYTDRTCLVQGRDPQDKKVLVLWRDQENDLSSELLGSVEAKMPFDTIYLNGSTPKDTLFQGIRIASIEEAFGRLLFLQEGIPS
jgi:adenine-specific DNA-methyltransferase